MQPTSVVYFLNINQKMSVIINDIIANHHYVIHQDNGFLPQHLIICCETNDILQSQFLLVYKVTLFLYHFPKLRWLFDHRWFVGEHFDDTLSLLLFFYNSYTIVIENDCCSSFVCKHEIGFVIWLQYFSS